MSNLHPRALARARFLAATGRRQLALALLGSPMGEPANPEASRLRGKILAQMGRYQEAIDAWQPLVAVTPPDPEALVAVAKAKELLANPRAAQLSARRPLRLAAAVLVVGVGLGAAWFALRGLVNRWDEQRVERMVARLQPNLTELGSELTSSLRLHAADQRAQMSAALDNLDLRLQSQLSARAGEVNTQLNTLRDGFAVATELMGRELRNLGDGITNLHATINEADARQAAERRAQMTATLDGLGQTNDRIAGQLRTVGDGLSQRLEKLQSKASGADAKLAAQGARLDQILNTVVTLLRPQEMDGLERDIKDTEAKLVRLEELEIRYRHESKQVLFSKHAGTVRDMRETEARLAALKQRWETQVVPWLRARALLAPTRQPSSPPTVGNPE